MEAAKRPPPAREQQRQRQQLQQPLPPQPKQAACIPVEDLQVHRRRGFPRELDLLPEARTAQPPLLEAAWALARLEVGQTRPISERTWRRPTGQEMQQVLFREEHR